MAAALLLSPQLADSLVEAIRAGVPIEVAARAAGVSHETIYEWIRSAQRGTWHAGVAVEPATLKIIVAFAERVARAQAEREAEAVQRIREYTDVKGNTDWRAEAWWLERGPARNRWRPAPQQVETSGQVHHLHEHKLASAMTDDELAQALEQVIALPAPGQSSSD